MQITRKTEYAVRTITIQGMVRAGFVETRRGTGGGVRLIKSGDSFSLADVLEVFEGPIAINSCLRKGGSCPNSSTYNHQLHPGFQGLH